MSARMRINRFLAASGLGSRRKVEDLIRKGSVFVNGVRIEEFAVNIDPDSDSVIVDGLKVEMTSETTVLVLNKPVGVLSTVKDDFGRKTVINLAYESGYRKRLFPVGRLDMDTSGIILLTDDGELSYRLTHPGYKIDKTYEVLVRGEVSKETAGKIASGVKLEDYITQRCSVRIIRIENGETKLEVILREGRNRQVRKMFAEFGYKVKALHRRALGDLSFEDVGPGKIRPLTSSEKDRLKKQTGLL